jgi:hypothetical protein
LTEFLTIYQTPEWTAEILTDENGEVLDCQVTPKPMSDFDRRMRERERSPRHFPRPWNIFPEQVNP